MKQANLKIKGLSCGHCVSSVEALLNNTEGVISTNVCLPDSAGITYDETKVSIEDIKKIINDSEIYKVE